MMRRGMFLVGILSALAALSGCSKGSFEGEITMHTTTASGPPHDMTVMTNGDKLRFDMVSNKGEKTHGLFDPATSKVVFFLDAQKVYMDGDFSKPNTAPNTNPATATAKKTGRRDTIAGYDCDNWSVQDGTGKSSEVCIAKGIAYFDVGSLRPGSEGATSATAKEFRDTKSFPLRSIEYDATGKEISRMEVVKIEKKKLDVSIFDVPADYKKMEQAH